MRRNYISPEFDYKKVQGTLNMLEQSTFFGSKMLDIDDKIEVKNETIIYYQQSNGEQINLDTELGLPQVTYTTVIDKNQNHQLVIDDSQSFEERFNNTRWILDINVKDILTNYLYATMKKYRTFEGVLNNITSSNSVNTALLDYIKRNVISRYKFSRVELYIKDVDLLTMGNLRYNNRFDENIENGNTLFNKFSTETDPNELDIRLIFYQPKVASKFSFNYYYNLYFEKL